MKPKVPLFAAMVAFCAIAIFDISAEACWRHRRPCYGPAPCYYPPPCYYYPPMTCDGTQSAGPPRLDPDRVAPPWRPRNKYEAELGGTPQVGGRYGNLKTLDGNPPLIIGHRGLPGLYPEEVIAGYRAAIAAGADSLEFDLHSSSDGVLFACHNAFLSDTTDVANHPKFASRKKSRTIDGVATGPDWYISDFTAAELKTLRVKQPIATRGKQHDGKYPMATFQEIIDLVKQIRAADPKRKLTIYPETKNPIYQRLLGVPLEGKLVAMLKKEGWNTPGSPVFVQSFEPASLKRMRKMGLKTKVVQLLDGDGIDFKTGAMTYGAPDTAKPFSWLQAGDPRTFAAMVTPAGLAEIKTYADGIGPWKLYILPPQGVDASGKAVKSLDRASNMAPTSLVADAHKAGLFVHAFTFRDEAARLTKTYRGDPKAEYKAYFDLGVDGVFTDFSTTGRVALNEWLKARAAK